MDPDVYKEKFKEAKKWKRKIFRLIGDFTSDSVTVEDLNNYSEKLKEIRSEYNAANEAIDDIIVDLEDNDESDHITDLEAIQKEMKDKIDKNEEEVKNKVTFLKKSNTFQMMNLPNEEQKKEIRIQKTWPSEHQEQVQHALVLSLAVYEEDAQAYLQSEMPNHGFSSLVKSKHGNCHFLLAEEFERNRLYLSFRGTMDMNDVSSDLKIFLKESKISGGKFHSGFLARADEFPLKKVLSANQFSKKELVVCGHSLGGAVSSIVTAQILLEKEICQKDCFVGDVINITFGSPLFGDLKAKRFMDEKKYSSKMFHFVAEKDPVPSLLSKTQCISAMSSMVEDQIRNFVGPVSPEKMKKLLEKKKHYQECMSRVIPAMEPLLKIATLISPTNTAVITATGIYGIVNMMTSDDDEKVKKAYTPIGNFFFLYDGGQDLKFLSTEAADDVRMALDTLKESNPESHILTRYRDLCLKNKLFYDDQYPLQWDIPMGPSNDSNYQEIQPRRIQNVTWFCPWVRSAELGLIEKGPGEVVLRLVLHGMNLSEIILTECTFELGFPFGHSHDTDVKRVIIQHEELTTQETDAIKKLGIPRTGNMEDIVVEQVMKMSKQEISEKLSASDHGTEITVVTMFDKFEYTIPQDKLGREIKPPSLAQLAKHESIALVIRKVIQRVIAIGQIDGNNTQKQEILDLAKLTLEVEDHETLMNILETNDVQKILSNETEYRKIDQICTAIGNRIKSNMNIEIEKTLMNKVLIVALGIAAAGAIGYIAGPGLLVLGAADSLSKSTIAAAASAATTGGATTGYAANRYFTEQYSESSYNKSLRWLTTQLFDVYKRNNPDSTEVSDLIHDGSIYSTEKALIQMFNEHKTIDENFEGTLVENTTEDTKKEIKMRINCISSVHNIRNILAEQCFIGLVGLQDAGKTTLLNKIWGLEGKTGLFDHTDLPELHEITRKVNVIDFPGSNSLEYHRKTFSNCGAMNNLIILVVPFNGDINSHMSKEVAKVYEVMKGSESCKVLICVNKCGEKLKSLKQELKDKDDPLGFIRKRYVDKLNEQFTNKPWITIDEEHLLFTDWMADQEAVDFGIKTVFDVKSMIKKYLVDLNVLRSDDHDELEAAVSPRQT